MRSIVLIALALTTVGIRAAETPPAKKLPLRESIDLALKADHAVNKAAHALDGAKARLASARGKYFPKIDLELNAGTFHDRNAIPGDLQIPSVARDRNNYLAQVKFSQPIFSGFGHSSTMSKREYEQKVKELELDIAKETAIEQTIALYFGVQLLEKQIRSEKEAQVMRESQRKEIGERTRHGAATDLQQLQAEYAVKQQVPKILELETDLSTKRLRLYRALNLPLGDTFELTDLLPDRIEGPLAFKLPDLPHALDYALRNSLRIRKLEAEVHATQSESGESLAPHLPRLDLELSAGSNAFQRADIASSDSLAYGAQLKLVVPLFSGLESLSDRSYWRARLDELTEERARLRESILDELNETYRKLEMTSHRLEASRVNLELTERAVKKAREFYRMGRSTLTEVLDAYSANLEAKKQGAQDIYDRVVALFRVKSILGLGASYDEKN